MISIVCCYAWQRYDERVCRSATAQSTDPVGGTSGEAAMQPFRDKQGLEIGVMLIDYHGYRSLYLSIVMFIMLIDSLVSI